MTHLWGVEPETGSLREASVHQPYLLLAPRELWLQAGDAEAAHTLAVDRGARVLVTDDVALAPNGMGHAPTDGGVGIGESGADCATRRSHDRFRLAGAQVSSDLIKSPATIDVDQAANRPHTIKAVLVSALGREGRRP